MQHCGHALLACMLGGWRTQRNQLSARVHVCACVCARACVRARVGRRPGQTRHVCLVSVLHASHNMAHQTAGGGGPAERQVAGCVCKVLD